MLGTNDPQAQILDAESVAGHLIKPDSVYRKLAQMGDRLFSDEDFADLYHPDHGRHSVPPSLLAKVQLLQSLEGVSDREACQRVVTDLRWKVALQLPIDHEGFHNTVLVYFRQRLRTSAQPSRIFDWFRALAEDSGLLDKKLKRVLDSTPVHSAVQTQDSFIMIRSAMRQLLEAMGTPRSAGEIRKRLKRTEYDQILGKPDINWDSEQERNRLMDELVTDALAALHHLEGKKLKGEVQRCADLLATVAGQDVEQTEDGKFKIRQGVAKSRVISTVDPEVRHGRKSNRSRFDGYKAHVAVEPDTEIITEVKVTPGNVHDSVPVPDLLPELNQGRTSLTVLGDSAYGPGATRQWFEDKGVTCFVKQPPERNSTGGFPKSEFAINLEYRTIICPNNVSITGTLGSKGSLRFKFPAATCNACPLKASCTHSSRGRSVTVGPYEHLLAAARKLQTTPEFKPFYNGNRPTVERVIYRLVRRGGRKARYRGTVKVQAQLELRAAAENLTRMFRLGLTATPEGWTVKI
jgi:IS5 family transposase/transposase